ncbi:hypothetical protein K7W42_12910 [Deinococcus sp. HMF7604]|uniref:hypothetical protein n=1 Tax=Deinococcus betulae TaxID=2873312 RepID=UPI001CCD6517|nr:hypothetical protein [Deinococcus betulae]MBZ9751757.1 hypothetical protein [Deinococcus betulae]
MTLTVFESVKRLDLLISQSPPSDFQEIVALTQNDTVDKYLFHSLQRGDWLLPLIQNQFFADDVLNERPYRLAFLRQFLPGEAALVSDILRDCRMIVPQSRIEFLNLLIEMPAVYLRSLLAEVEGWVTDPVWADINYPLEQLTVRALKESEFEGLDWFLLRLLLMPHQYKTQEGNYYVVNADDWRMEYFLDQHEEILRNRNWYIPLLIDILAAYSAIQERRPYGLSTGSRHLLHQQFESNESAVSQLSSLIIKSFDSMNDVESFEITWDQLRRYPYEIFTRLRLVLLSKISNPKPRFVRLTLMDRYAFYRYDEYQDAVRAHFLFLSDEDRQIIWQWAREEFSLLNSAYYEKNYPQGLSQHLRRNLWKRLQTINPYIPDDLQKQWRQLSEQYGEQESYGPNFYVQDGTSSILTPQDLATLSLTEIAKLLSEDPPSTGDEHFDEPHHRIAGLRDVLRRDVVQRPDIYFTSLDFLKSIPPEYLSTIIYTMRAEENSPLPGVRLVIELLHFSNHKSQTNPLGDHEWSDCVGGLADLITERILKDELTRSNLVDAPQLLDVLREGLKDPDPPLDEDSEQWKVESDRFSQSLNVARGKIMHALLKFMGWAYDYSSEHGDLAANQLLVESKQIIFDHLSSGVEKSAAVYTAPVRNLPWIMFIDPVLGKKLVEILFDRRHPQISRPVWTAHLMWNRFYSQFFAVTRSFYAEYAVQDLPSTGSALWSTDKEVQRAFGQHVAMHYIRNDLNLFEDDRIIEAFLNYADDIAVVETLTFLNQSLRNTSGETRIYANRLQSWWEILSGADNRFNLKERKTSVRDEFGLLFSNPLLELDWKFSQLSILLESSEVLPKTVSKVLAEFKRIVGDSTQLVLKYTKQIVDSTSIDRRQAHLILQLLEQTRHIENPELVESINGIVEGVMEQGYTLGFQQYHR